MRSTDALLISYPKSGMTWLRFLLAHAVTGSEADFDSIRLSIPPLGSHRHAPAVLPSGGRVIRSHEPVPANRGRPGQPIVYLVRDGRDVLLSYLAHERRNQRFAGDVHEFLEVFLAGRVDGYGPWHDHVLAGVGLTQQQANPFLLVHYERLRRDPAAELGRVLAFLGCESDRADLEAVVAANGKEQMRAKEASSTFLASQRNDGTPFVRPDKSSDWERDVPDADKRRFEAVCGPALLAAGYDVATTRE
jgi:Sulfotransferase domain